MNQLDLTRLNFRSPYQVWEGERGYCFKTDHGIFYTVEFDPEGHRYTLGRLIQIKP